eukprot:2128464-Amphidinium_carterae.1
MGGVPPDLQTKLQWSPFQERLRRPIVIHEVGFLVCELPDEKDRTLLSVKVRAHAFGDGKGRSHGQRRAKELPTDRLPVEVQNREFEGSGRPKYPTRIDGSKVAEAHPISARIKAQGFCYEARISESGPPGRLRPVTNALLAMFRANAEQSSSAQGLAAIGCWKHL